MIRAQKKNSEWIIKCFIYFFLSRVNRSQHGLSMNSLTSNRVKIEQINYEIFFKPILNEPKSYEFFLLALPQPSCKCSPVASWWTKSVHWRKRLGNIYFLICLKILVNFVVFKFFLKCLFEKCWIVKWNKLLARTTIVITFYRACAWSTSAIFIYLPTLN